MKTLLTNAKVIDPVTETISDGVKYPYLFESIHCLFEKTIPTSGIVITKRDVTENGKPFKKIRLG